MDYVHLFSKGEEYRRRGDFERAVHAFEDVLETTCPDTGDKVYARLAEAYRKVGKHSNVDTLYQKLKSAGGKIDVYFLLNYALSLSHRGMLKQALSVCDEARLIPDSQDVRILRIKSKILMEQNMFDLAIDPIVEILNIGTDEGDSAGKWLLALRDLKIKREQLRKAGNDERLRAYWSEREAYVYLHVCRQIVAVIGKTAKAVVDIGSNRTPLLDCFPGRPIKYSVDPVSPYDGGDVVPVYQDFMTWNPSTEIHVGTCLQVMEHVPDVRSFARRILDLCEVSIVSVPYRERAGANPGHLHSMIEYGTICAWFERRPNFFYVAKELSGQERIICVFDRASSEEYTTLSANCPNGLGFRFRWSLAGSGVIQHNGRASVDPNTSTKA